MAPSISGSQWFPMWAAEDSDTEDVDRASVHMASVRISSGPALLVDTGSPGNVCGSEWSEEMASAAASAGREPPEYQKRGRPLAMSGIGAGSQVAE